MRSFVPAFWATLGVFAAMAVVGVFVLSVLVILLKLSGTPFG